MKTGYIELDEIIDFEKPQLILVTARPAMGKSTFLSNLVRNIGLEQEMPILYISLERSKEEAYKQILSASSEINELNLIEEKDNPTVIEWNNKIRKSKIVIEDKAIMIDEIIEEIRRQKNSNGIKLVFIDSIQYIKNTTEEVNMEDINVSYLEKLKKISKDLNVTIIISSNLSRKPENRKEHRPIVFDVLKSETVLKVVDKIILLYRDEYYDCATLKKKIMEVTVWSNKYVNTIELFCDLSKYKIKEKYVRTIKL